MYGRKKFYRTKVARRAPASSSANNNNRKRSRAVAFGRSRPFIGLPSEMWVQLMYHETQTYTHTSGAMGNQVYRANSVYDPRYAVGGHQPTGFDELAALYQRYLVTAASLKVEASCLTAGGSNIPLTVAIVPCLEVNTLTDIDTAVEQPLAKSITYSGSASDTSTYISKTCYLNVRKLFGVRTLDDVDYSAAVTTDPNQACFFDCYMRPANQASTSISAVTFTIKYWVKFYKRQVTNSS